MKYVVDDPRAILVLVVILGAGFFASRMDWAGRSGGLVQVSTSTGGSASGQLGFNRAGVLTSRVAGPRTSEEVRQLWGSEGQALVLDYKVTVDSGRLNLRVREVGMLGRTVWTTGIESSKSERVRIPLTSSGNYEVIVRMSSFGGSYEVSYGLQ